MKRIYNSIYTTVILLLFLLLPVVSMAEDLSSGIIKGRVINNTLDGKGVRGIEIILYEFVDGKESEIGRTKTDPAGSFSFQGISVDKKIVYYSTTKYKEVEYFSQPIGFEDKKTLTLDLIVYETTGQDTDIYAKMHHIFLEIKGDSLWIKELMIVENRGDMVYVGHNMLEPGKKETLRISLPKEAANIKYIDGLMPYYVVKTEQGFSDTIDIKPGMKKILFSYTVDYRGPGYQFKKGIPLKTDNIDFFFPDKGIKVKSNQLEFKGTLGDSAGRFSRLSGKNFPKGSQIVIEFHGLPWMKNLFKWVIIGLVIVLIGAGFAFSFIKRGQYQDEGEGQASRPNKINLSGQKQAVLQAIAELDDLSESGGVDSEEYRMKRAELLKKAKEITKQLKLSF
ncbi:MAG: hypothetical protein C4549_03115 [Deltaproteobacteria bacterium]|nr:MAG: hypothetical protein C4549_03115 [Deltaproteobacteria bacterium]